MPGPGLIQERVKNQWQLSALLYNFEIDSAELKSEHKEWLKKTVQPYYLYSRSMQAVITGMASRTHTDAHNYGLSQSRAASVDSFIYRMDLRKPRILPHHLFAVGEEAAMLAGQADEVEDARYRAVFLEVYDPTKVPRLPPPPLPPILVDRTVMVKFFLTDRDVGIPKSGEDAKADRIAEASRKALQAARGATPLYEQTKLIDQQWTVTTVRLTKDILDATVAGVGNVSEWLTVEYFYEPAAKGQKRVLVKDGQRVREIDWDEMSDWHDEPLQTYRAHYTD